MRNLRRAAAATALAAGLALSTMIGTPAQDQASAAGGCAVTWGSLPKKAGTLGTDQITNLRSGRHQCFDRLVVDMQGNGAAGYQVRYVSSVGQAGSGDAVPLRGGAKLQITAMATTYDPETGSPTYDPANPAEAVDVSGYDTFRQVALAGSFEGQTTIGLGVRARLPMRAFTIDGPAHQQRLVVDVAHQW